MSTPGELVVWAIEHPSHQMWLGPGCNGKGLQLWGWGPSIFRHDTREAAQARLDELRAQGVALEGYEVAEHLEVPFARDTDPAPAPPPTERVPSMTEEDFDRLEADTAVGCPHPPGLDG